MAPIGHVPEPSVVAAAFEKRKKNRVHAATARKKFNFYIMRLMPRQINDEASVCRRAGPCASEIEGGEIHCPRRAAAKPLQSGPCNPETFLLGSRAENRPRRHSSVG